MTVTADDELIVIWYLIQSSQLSYKYVIFEILNYSCKSQSFWFYSINIKCNCQKFPKFSQLRTHFPSSNVHYQIGL